MCVLLSKREEQLYLDAIWMMRIQILTSVSNSKICIDNTSQIAKTEDKVLENWDSPVRSMGTELPQSQGRGQSSESEQVTESPGSPHHLDTQGQKL